MQRVQGDGPRSRMQRVQGDGPRSRCVMGCKAGVVWRLPRRRTALSILLSVASR